MTCKSFGSHSSREWALDPRARFHSSCGATEHSQRSPLFLIEWTSHTSHREERAFGQGKHETWAMPWAMPGAMPLGARVVQEDGLRRVPIWSITGESLPGLLRAQKIAAIEPHVAICRWSKGDSAQLVG